MPNPSWKPNGKYRWNLVEIDDDMESLDDIVINKRRGFKQGNSDQNIAMREWLAKEMEALNKNSPVLELFCGAGNFTEVISKAGFNNILACKYPGSAPKKLMALELSG